jgi:hypothetical protein
MIFLPIVVRELRVAARRKSTYRMRFRTAFAAIVFGSYLVFVFSAFSGGGRASMGGLMVFNGLAWLCFLCCLSLAINTVDCISEEKREGTLGFLFLTDLKGHDIVLGKLFSSSLVAFYSILGILPIVAVSMLLGGVSARQYWLMALALLNVFFFSQAAGLVVSAFSRKRNSASFGATVLLLGYTAGLPLLEFGLEAAGWGNWVSSINWLNPAFCVSKASAMASGDYWISMILVQLNAWLLLAVASWWLPRCWQERAGKTGIHWRERFLRWYHERNTPLRLLLDKNPFLWLSIRNRLGPVKVWSSLVLVNCFWAWCLRWNLTHGGSVEVVVPIFVGVIISNHAVLKLIVAGEATDTFEEQRHSGALEFLLSCSPLTAREIIAGQWLALRRQLLRPVIVVLVVDFAMMLAGSPLFMPHGDAADKLAFVLFVLAAMLMLVADAIALGWAGMWNAMSQKKLRHATGATIAQILVLPWLFFILIAVYHGIHTRRMWDSLTIPLLIWFILGIAVDVPAIFFARHQLLTRFRAMAAAQTGEQPGPLGHLGRWLGQMARPATAMPAR